MCGYSGIHSPKDSVGLKSPSAGVQLKPWGKLCRIGGGVVDPGAPSCGESCEELEPPRALGWAANAFVSGAG